MRPRRFSAVDLFCGAGGESEGLRLACEAAGLSLDLTAINHWDIAVETHSLNHPSARHLCEPIDAVSPMKVHKPGSLDLLWASPGCQDHSTAKVGALDDEARASAWHVVRWAEVLRPKWIGVENVARFLKWAPLGVNGRPLKSRLGVIFHEWVRCLRALGYTVEWRILNAADFGATQARIRLFVMARFDGVRSRGPIRWPLPTHAESTGGLFAGEALPWRTSREIIDLSLPSRSIFDRSDPLADATLARIADGFRRFGSADPFVLGQQSGSVARPLTRPIPTLSTGCAVGLVQPFLVQYNSEGSGKIARSLDRPLLTLTTKDRFGLVQPQLSDVHYRMLQPHECAAGQGFGPHYRFAGTKTDVMTQIGNAVEVNQARAINRVIVEHRTGAAA